VYVLYMLRACFVCGACMLSVCCVRAVFTFCVCSVYEVCMFVYVVYIMCVRSVCLV